MISYVCDYCDAHKDESGVELKGFAPITGILLPANFRHYHFCNRSCFLEWMIANNRDSLQWIVSSYSKPK